MRPIFLIILLFISLWSCNNITDEKSNIIIAYYDNENIKSISLKNDEFHDDVLIRFNQYSELEEIGHYIDNKPVGLFSYYVDTYLLQQRQYIVVDSSKHVNQFWTFDEKGNIIMEESNYFHLSASSGYY